MANTKRKLGAALGALALMVGAVPGTVGMAPRPTNTRKTGGSILIAAGSRGLTTSLSGWLQWQG